MCDGEETDLSLISTCDLCSEIIRRNNKSIIIMERSGRIPDGEQGFKIHACVPDPRNEEVTDVPKAVEMLKRTIRLFSR